MKKKKHTLPIELIREILLRLPVRSVLRFKCVCKSWLSLVSDPQFGISHYDLAAAPSHRLLLRSNDFYAQSIDIEAPLEIYYRNVVYFPLPLPSPPCVDHDYDDFHNQPEIFGSCRGIILLYYRGSDDLILWNPTIGVHKRLARSNFIYGIPYEFLFGFGYDVSTDEYLLILIALPEYERVGTEIHIFSFKTESWKMNKNYVNVSYEDLEDKFNVEDTFKAGTLFNGALHWLVFSTDKMVPVIIAFDLMQRTLSEIPVSDHVTEYEIYCLREMGGCLSLCCSVRGYEMPEIWVMKEYKVQASWTMSVITPTYDFSPICITKDGGIFGSNNTGGGRLEKLNDKGELLDYHNYGGGQGLYCANLQSAMYRESLLSLPSVIRATRGYEYGETSEDDHRETSEDDHGGTSEDDHWETSGDDRGETSEDDNRETSENDHGDTSEDDQQ